MAFYDRHSSSPSVFGRWVICRNSGKDFLHAHICPGLPGSIDERKENLELSGCIIFDSGRFLALGKGGMGKGLSSSGCPFLSDPVFCTEDKGEQKGFFRPSYPCLLVFALEYIFALEYGLEIFQNVFLVFAGCYWLLILWCRNREGFLEYCGDHEKLYRFPKQGIAYGNRLMLIFLTGLTVGCMVILPFLEIDRGILAVLELLRRFLAMLLSGEREAPEPEELPQEDMGAQPLFWEPEKNPLLC